MVDIYHVVVVEDDPKPPSTCGWFPSRGAGTRVDTVADADLAADILRRVEIDVVLTDTEVPGAAGVDPAARARKLVAVHGDHGDDGARLGR